MTLFKTIIAALALVTGAASATTYGSGGSSTKKIGSTTYVRDDHGNTTTYNKVGSTIVGSDGSTIKTIGNTTYINDGHGNITKCNVVGSTTRCN